jgi:hypothetical protein
VPRNRSSRLRGPTQGGVDGEHQQQHLAERLGPHRRDGAALVGLRVVAGEAAYTPAT